MLIFYIAVCYSVKMRLIIKDVLHAFIVFIQDGSFRFVNFKEIKNIVYPDNCIFFNFYYIDKLILVKVWNFIKNYN